jgi:hypothetical protein
MLKFSLKSLIKLLGKCLFQNNVFVQFHKTKIGFTISLEHDFQRHQLTKRSTALVNVAKNNFLNEKVKKTF